MPEDLARWLEEGLETIFEGGYRAMAVQAVRQDGEIISGYYHCDVNDKVMIARTVHVDAMRATLYANLDSLKDALDELEECE